MSLSVTLFPFSHFPISLFCVDVMYHRCKYSQTFLFFLYGSYFSAKSFVPWDRSPFRHQSLLILILAFQRFFFFQIFHTHSDPLSITSLQQNTSKTKTKSYSIIQFYRFCFYSWIISLIHLEGFYVFPLCMIIFCFSFLSVIVYPFQLLACCLCNVLLCVCFRLLNTVFFLFSALVCFMTFSVCAFFLLYIFCWQVYLGFYINTFLCKSPPSSLLCLSSYYESDFISVIFLLLNCIFTIEQNFQCSTKRKRNASTVFKVILYHSELYAFSTQKKCSGYVLL